MSAPAPQRARSPFGSGRDLDPNLGRPSGEKSWLDRLDSAGRSVSSFYYTHKIGLVWEVFQSTLGLVAFVVVLLYLYSDAKAQAEWRESASGFPRIFQIVVSLLFIVDYLLRLFMAPRKLSFLFSFWGVLDLIIIVLPLVSSSKTAWPLARSLRVLRILKLLMIAPQFSTLFSRSSSLQMIVTRVVTLVFIIAVILALTATWLPVLEEENFTSFHEALYFAVVTMSTVGYGDLSPDTFWGKIFVTLFIFATFAVVPSQVSELVTEIHRLNSLHLGTTLNLDDNIPFVLVTGLFSARDARTITRELLCRDNEQLAHELGKGDIQIRFLQHAPASTPMREMFGDPRLSARLRYTFGDPVSRDDIVQSRAHKADAIIVLPSSSSRSVEEADARSILYALAISRNCPDTRLIVCVHTVSARNRLRSFHVPTVLCQANRRNRVVAKSLGCPGASTLLVNMMMSSEIKIPWAATKTAPWLAEYLDGANHEIYAHEVDAQFDGRPFHEVAFNLWQSCDMLPFAVLPNPHIKLRDGKYKRVERPKMNFKNILLNPPHDHVLNDMDLLFVISDHPPKAMMQRYHHKSPMRHHDEHTSVESPLHKPVNVELRKYVRQVSTDHNILFEDNEEQEEEEEGKGKGEGEGKEAEGKEAEGKEGEGEAKEGGDAEQDHPVEVRPRSVSRTLRHDANDLRRLRNHLVVFGDMLTVDHFIAMVRAIEQHEASAFSSSSHQAPRMHILFVLEQPPSEQSVQCVGHHRDVSWVAGHMSLALLERARLRFARAIYIREKQALADRSVNECTSSSMRANLLVRRALHSQPPETRPVVITDARLESISEFLGNINGSSNQTASGHRHSPEFAAGYTVCLSDWWLPVCAQIVYKPYLLQMVDFLLMGQLANDSYTSLVLRDLNEATVKLLPTYGKLVESLMLGSAHTIPLGLYRPQGLKSSTAPYVSLNPPKDELLVPGDKVYCLERSPCVLE